MPPKSTFLQTLMRWWGRFSAAVVRGFHVYANWLVSISWKRFILLSVLLLIVAGIATTLPPFSWEITETYVEPPELPPHSPRPPKPPKPPAPSVEPAQPDAAQGKQGVEISIDKDGLRIRRAPAQADAASNAVASASAASGAASGASANQVADNSPRVHIMLPPGADTEEVRAALEQVREAVDEAVEQAHDAKRDVEQARRDAESAQDDVIEALHLPRVRTRTRQVGEFLPQLAFLWIVASLMLKITYKGRMQAEVKAAQATETAEAESLKRQVVEARMAAMQAQVEPHFLFNTLASIDHLIETDSKRASQMQKNLIALLRASMPTMREASDGAERDLGRELAVVKPYVEILKVRMEERLTAHIDVPAGLWSAQFPPMMIQTLVENAIRHGLEPKPEGGELSIKAEIVHGKLSVRVADTGVGFGQAATAGTGVGLANIRERLQLLYGTRATLTVAANAPSGTVVTITVPYKPIEPAGAPQA